MLCIDVTCVCLIYYDPFHSSRAAGAAVEEEGNWGRALEIITSH